MKIRVQVSQCVQDRTAALRVTAAAAENTSFNPSPPAHYQNISAVRADGMKFLPN